MRKDVLAKMNEFEKESIKLTTKRLLLDLKNFFLSTIKIRIEMSIIVLIIYFVATACLICLFLDTII